MKRLDFIRLEEVARFIRGVTFKPTDIISTNTPGAVVCMRTKNIQADLDEDDLIAVPRSVVKRREQFLEPGDILVSSANSWDLVGKCCWVEELNYSSTAGGFISILRANPNIIVPRYLYHWLNSSGTQEKLRLCGQQTTNISNLSFDRAYQINVPVPSLPEQQRIAGILDKADAIRRKRRQALRLADEFLRSTFLDLFGDPVTNSKGWKEVSLGEVTDIVSGVTKGRKVTGKTKSVPYMRVANIQDGHLDLSEVKEIEATNQEIDKYALKYGDILLTEGGDPDKLGRGTVWKNNISCCIHQNHIFRVRVSNDALLPLYASYLISSPRGKRYFGRAAKQTTGIASINMTQLKSFPLLVPPISIQQQFQRHAEMIDQLKVRIERSLEECNSLFFSISQRAFKGEL